MYGNLQIAGDPTIWWLAQPVDISKPPAQAISVTVRAPLAGTLLLSPRAAGVAAFSEPGEAGEPVNPDLPTPSLYLPTSSGPSAGSAGYTLSTAASLPDLVTEISAAMKQGSQCTVEFGGGILVLSGATLPFVVLCPANALLGIPSGTGGVPNDPPNLPPPPPPAPPASG
jgi:hypothetical protein